MESEGNTNCLLLTTICTVVCVLAYLVPDWFPRLYHLEQSHCCAFSPFASARATLLAHTISLALSMMYYFSWQKKGISKMLGDIASAEVAVQQRTGEAGKAQRRDSTKLCNLGDKRMGRSASSRATREVPRLPWIRDTLASKHCFSEEVLMDKIA